MQLIQYTDKSALNENSEIADINKCNATDMNEIKSVINANVAETEQDLLDMQTYITTSTNSIRDSLDLLMTFDTDEVNTEQTWYNGRYIYRKVINVGALPDTSSISVAHNITNLGQFVKILGLAIRSSDNDTLPLPYITFNANNAGGIVMYVNNTSIVINTSTNRSAYNGYVILEYVKNY